VKLYSLLKKDATNDQLCYYQPGIGTYFQPGVVSPFFQWGAMVLDEAFAWYLDEHVRGGYQFLMQNWRVGDKICIFGFSRGAYTARALAGMLHKIGLLPKDNPEQIPFAYKLYTKTDKASLTIAAGFKQTFCRTVEIEFVGVWETVSSVGVISGKTLPFTTANQTIKVFRHALALDEHRAKFRPNLYHRATPEQKEAAKKTKKPKSGSKEPKSTPKAKQLKLEDIPAVKALNGKEPLSSVLPHTQLTKDDGQNEGDDVEGGTDILEVWFAGCHADVGGGSVSDTTVHSLSGDTLRWMVRQVVLSQCGIMFDSEALLRANIPDSVFTGVGFAAVAATTSPEQVADSKLNSPIADEESPSANPFASPKLLSKAIESVATSDATDDTNTDTGPTSSGPINIDALQPIYDQLKINPLWWILEIIPLTYSYQDTSGKWHKSFSIHFGRGRKIIDSGPNFHISVKERINDTPLKYKPRASWPKGTEKYID